MGSGGGGGGVILLMVVYRLSSTLVGLSADVYAGVRMYGYVYVKKGTTQISTRR